MNIRINENTMA